MNKCIPCQRKYKPLSTEINALQNMAPVCCPSPLPSATSDACGCLLWSRVPSIPSPFLLISAASSFTGLPTTIWLWKCCQSHQPTPAHPFLGTHPEAGQLDTFPAILYRFIQREQCREASHSRVVCGHPRPTCKEEAWSREKGGQHTEREEASEPGRGRTETTMDIPEFLELWRSALVPHFPVIPIHLVLASPSFTWISVALPICASLRSLVELGGDTVLVGAHWLWRR